MCGREAEAAASVAAPFSFMYRIMRLCAQAVQLKGIVMILCDWDPLGKREARGLSPMRLIIHGPKSCRARG
jgi:hypothetical protein